ncbi:DHH family phosphoesterase [Candidatus Saccharibacteria bacterium]|nr:DHH family phosphoesterase [Candidatus Saccharibacteria bacterium]
METETQKLSALIENSQRIIITSHTSPDPDAVASLILTGTGLQINYPNKQIEMVLEEEPSGLDFLTQFNQIKFQPLVKALDRIAPDLLIIVDANAYKRVSRMDDDAIRQYIREKSVRTAIIDHHEPEGRDETDVYINSHNIAAVQEVYEVLFDQLELKKPDNYAQVTMLGLYADSGGFAYAGPRHKETMQLAAKLVEAGVNIEEIKNKINQFTDEQMKVISELTRNVTNGGEYTYTFLSDAFVDGWQQDGQTMAALHGATKPFVDSYIRNVGGRQWGFLVYRDSLDGQNMYSVSLRSVGGIKDVSVIARRLDDGGGHKPAAGGRVRAESVREAIKKVKSAILEP